MNLTTRQSEILKAIIEDYIESAQPVASIELVERRNLKISGATVRNIMADLVRKGYLQMLHVSSGRVPSELAYRYYISELMDERDVSVLDELSIKQKVWNDRYELERLLCNISNALSETTSSLAFAMTTDGFASYAGTSHLLDMPEFYEIDVAKSVFKLIDDYQLSLSIYEKTAKPNMVTVLIGREIGLANMEPVSIVVTNCNIENKTCYIGVIGPSRTDYCKLIPLIRHVAELVDEINETM